MNKIKLLMTFVSLLVVSLPVFADYTIQTIEQLPYSSYSQNQAMYPQNGAVTPYYAPGTVNPSYYQPQYQYQNQYSNPYAYPNQSAYGYNNYGYNQANRVPYSVVNSALSGNGVGGAKGQILKNIGTSMLYSMMRGY